MVAVPDPKMESGRPTPMPARLPSLAQHPEAAADDDPMAWRESDFRPVKIRGKPLSDTVIEDRG